MSLEISSLEHCGIKTIHNAFSMAFSDYSLPFNPSPQQLEYLLQRRGYSSQLSFGAFSHGQLVSFILNGIDIWNGVKTAYDTGTGTVPHYRKKGIASAVFREALPILKQHGIAQYMLDVLTNNTAAIDLYLKTGFTIKRTFHYYVTPVAQMKINTNRVNGFHIKQAAFDWHMIGLMENAKPSWQNSSESVMRKQLAMKCLYAYAGNDIVGYAIIEPHTGDVPQMAVMPAYRRSGVATALLHELTKHTQTSLLRFANVDASYEPFVRFMEVTGQLKGSEQYEMVMGI